MKFSCLISKSVLSNWSKLRPNPDNFQTRTSTEMQRNQHFVTITTSPQEINKVEVCLHHENQNHTFMPYLGSPYPYKYSSLSNWRVYIQKLIKIIKKLQFLPLFWAKIQHTCSYQIVHAYWKFTICWSTCLINSTRQLDSEE